MIKIRVGVILIKKDKILLAKHLKRGQGYWVLPGGAAEHGETLAEAAIREVREETGLKIKIDKLVFVSDYIPPGGRRHTIDFFFTGRVISGHLRKGSDRFLDEVRYFPVSALDKLVFYPYISSEIKDGAKDKFKKPVSYLGNRSARKQ